MVNKQITITRSKRKTIALHVLPDASIEVKVPWIFPTKKIEEFIKLHEEWIRQKQEEIRRRGTVHRASTKFETCEEFWYLGKKYPLTVTANISQALLFNNAFYLHELNRKNAETFFLSWYKKQALELFNRRVANYASQAKLQYQSILLSSAESKWGSCSWDNKLMFNWRLIMAPLPVIDSVIFHELAHIMEKNHTKKFWRRVTMWCPEYDKHKKWLDENGHLLRI